MKILFLRGKVPTDRDPKEIKYSSLKDCDDMWTHLANSLIGQGDKGEIWYWGGERKKKYNSRFTERWVKDFKTYKGSFEPDVIFCRGGFKEYITVLKRYPYAYKIYYGAGKRFIPKDGITYDLILQDSPEQVDECKSKHKNSKVELFVKPTVDDMFLGIQAEKKYDICFPANGTQSFKGHDFVYSTVPEDLKVLHLGFPHKIKPPKNVKSKRVLRKDIAKYMSQCKIGIVCVSKNFDSCPRVIPEMIACNIPIVVMDGVRFWKDKYINEFTGTIASKSEFWDKVREVISKDYMPAEYYINELSLERAASMIRGYIRN